MVKAVMPMNSGTHAPMPVTSFAPLANRKARSITRNTPHNGSTQRRESGQRVYATIASNRVSISMVPVTDRP